MREIVGQVMRLLATVPGFVFGWIPKGNTGGANVSALKPMAPPEDLRHLVDFSVGRDVGLRVLILLALACLPVGWVAWEDAKRGRESAELERQWASRVVQKVGNFGTTDTLEVIPLVNWRANGDHLRTEAGVSYLVKTDRHTILFDVGFNRKEESPSPLQHNMAALGVKLSDIDTLFFSHAHRDHLGGTVHEKARSFSLGLEQQALDGKRVFAPVPLTYPGLQVETVSQGRALLPGVASSGPLARRLLLGRTDEQALVIHVKGRGLVALVGCGHQTMPKLLQQIQETFSEPLIGIIGDIHYPMPKGRLYVAGIDAQRWVASGDGVWRPISREQIDTEIAELGQQLEFIALGSHDTSDEALKMAADAFGDRFQAVQVGKSIRVSAAAVGAQTSLVLRTE